MIDIHTHILPGIDDGSKDFFMTEAMLREEAEQGITLIAATPHFYPDRMSVEGFLDQRSSALECAEEIRGQSMIPLPAIVCGSEVYYFSGIGQAEMIPRLCIGSSRALLLELPFEQWEAPLLSDLRDLLNRGLRIILAHVERYEQFQHKRDVRDSVMALPVMKQINAGSFLKAPGISGLLAGNRKRAFCMKFLREHPETLIGSDCHNITGRKPNLAPAAKVISSRLGEELLARTQQAARTALELNAPE